MIVLYDFYFFFFFKQKTAYEIVSRDWSSDVCSSDLVAAVTLKHESDSGDGVRGRVVSSRTGLLGEWTVHHGQEQTPLEQVEVGRGDTIDFIVDGRANEESDSFNWAPAVSLTAPGAGSYAP